MLESGRLPAPSEFGLPGRGSNQFGGGAVLAHGVETDGVGGRERFRIGDEGRAVRVRAEPPVEAGERVRERRARGQSARDEQAPPGVGDVQRLDDTCAIIGEVRSVDGRSPGRELGGKRAGQRAVVKIARPAIPQRGERSRQRGVLEPPRRTGPFRRGRKAAGQEPIARGRKTREIRRRGRDQ